jgi:hypothetical protein
MLLFIRRPQRPKRARSHRNTVSSQQVISDPDHRRHHGRQDAFALPECMSGLSVSCDGFGSLPTVVSCLTLVSHGA